MAHSVELPASDRLHSEHSQLCKDRGAQVLHDGIAAAGRSVLSQSGQGKGLLYSALELPESLPDVSRAVDQPSVVLLDLLHCLAVLLLQLGPLLLVVFLDRPQSRLQLFV